MPGERDPGESDLGERDLARLLQGMEPVLHPEPWGFALVDEGAVLAEQEFALIREAEGLTLVAPQARLQARGCDASPPMARISLTIHSSLEAVGLTAAIAATLAARGISANVVAGYHHDHVFLPWNRRDEALKQLRALAKG
jgi:uncharacterized protein